MMEGNAYEEEGEDNLIPDEFSDENQQEMEEFEHNEENFEARQSISSRGSVVRNATKDRQVKSNIMQVCTFSNNISIESDQR